MVFRNGSDGSTSVIRKPAMPITSESQKARDDDRVGERALERVGDLLDIRVRDVLRVRARGLGELVEADASTRAVTFRDIERDLRRGPRVAFLAVGGAALHHPVARCSGGMSRVASGEVRLEPARERRGEHRADDRDADGRAHPAGRTWPPRWPRRSAAAAPRSGSRA